MVTPRRVDVHLLEPVSVEGLDVSARDQLASEVRSRLARALHELYGIESSPEPSGSVAARVS